MKRNEDGEWRWCERGEFGVCDGWEFCGRRGLQQLRSVAMIVFKKNFWGGFDVFENSRTVYDRRVSLIPILTPSKNNIPPTKLYPPANFTPPNLLLPVTSPHPQYLHHPHENIDKIQLKMNTLIHHIPPHHPPLRQPRML